MTIVGMQYRCRFLPVLLVLILLLTVGIPASADISNLTCAIAQPADLNAVFNAGQVITLHAAWAGDTPPFSATFQGNGGAIGAVNTGLLQADFSIGAAGLQEGANTFGVTVLETSVPNAVSQSATANGQVKIDRIPPAVTVTVLTGGVVSPVPGYNEVVFRVTSSEPLGTPPELTVSPSGPSAPQADPPADVPYTNTTYKLQVPAGTLPGVYTIRAIGRDDTLPAASRNQGAGQTTFQVTTGSAGAPAITQTDPVSPLRVSQVKLRGTVPQEDTGVQKVEVLEGGSVAGTVSVAAGQTTWEVAISNLTEGSHSFSARRSDPLGNVSGSSAPVTVVVDLTAPSIPVILPAKTPINTPTVSISGTGVSDPPYQSAPLKITLERDGAVVGSTTANADGTFTFTNVTLNEGRNLFMARAADTTSDGSSTAGNQSAFSNFIEVVLDQTPPTVIPGGISISSPATPTRPSAPPGSQAFPGISPQSGELSSEAVAFRDEALADGPLPIGGSYPGLGARLFLPQASIQDRYPASVQATVEFRFPWDVPAAFHAMPMQREEGGFGVRVPHQGHGLLYRFRMRDRAGNVGILPESGWLRLVPQRTEVLRVVMFPSAPDQESFTADEWPTATFGLPPVARLQAYRRLIVEESLLEQMQSFLAGVVACPDLVVRESPRPTMTQPSWQADLKALQAHELPAGRIDLLLSDIVSGNVPAELLPDPETVTGDRRLRDAIRFRSLHDRPR